MLLTGFEGGIRGDTSRLDGPLQHKLDTDRARECLGLRHAHLSKLNYRYPAIGVKSSRCVMWSDVRCRLDFEQLEYWRSVERRAMVETC